MNRRHPDERRCVFEVRCDHAQQVKLVLEYRRGVSQIFSLEPCGDGLWRTTLDLAPGDYRYCYHAYNGRTLTYITPPDAPMDGLKAKLHVEPAPVATRRSEPTTHHHSVSLRPHTLDWARRWMDEDEDDRLLTRPASPLA
ncbi:MAG: hypothetical protein ACODAQ_06275 [Phycisphaeraceae bacterium]